MEDEVDLLRRAGHGVALLALQVDEARGAKVARDALWSRSVAERLRQLIRKHKPDLVHFHNLYPTLSPAPIRAASEQGVPTVMTLHNFRLLCLPATLLRNGAICEVCIGHIPWRGVVHACYRSSRPASAVIAASLTLHRALATFSKISLFLSVSEFGREKYIRAGIQPKRIRVKPNFVDSLRQRASPGAYFLYLGRLSYEKGLDDLLRSWPEGVRLVIVGDGPERGRLEQTARAGVEFRGRLDPSDALALLDQARALVLPSRCYEGAPRAVLEAFAAGVPVISSSLGGLPELVEHGANGLVVPPADASAWREAVGRLADDSESERLGRGALETWEARFSPEKGLVNLLDAYEEALRVVQRET